MASILGRHSIDNIEIVEVDADPSAAAGTPAPVGSLASQTDGGGLWIKSTAADTGWEAAGGSGDVAGPASSTDNAIVRFSGTTGKIVKSSGVTISDTGDMTLFGKLDLGGGAVIEGTGGSPEFALAIDSTNVLLATAAEVRILGNLTLQEGSAPASAGGYGKLYVSSTNSRIFFQDDAGQSYNLTSDRFDTINWAASTPLDFSPSLPTYRSLTLGGNTTLTTSNLGNGRSIAVRIVGGASDHTLTFPAWSWLGAGAPTSLAAGDVAVLSVAAFGAADTDVVASWAFENQNAAAALSGTPQAGEVAYWDTTSSVTGSPDLLWNAGSKTFHVRGATDTELFYIDGPDDFVGVGTSSPTEKLTVDGFVSTTSGVKYPDGSSQVTAPTGRAGIHASGAGSFTISTFPTYTKIPFATDMGVPSSGFTEDTANNEIDVTAAGTYLLMFTGTPSVETTEGTYFTFLDNGVDVTSGAYLAVMLSDSVGTMGISMSYVVSTAGATSFSVGIAGDGGVTTRIVEVGQFIVVRLA